MKFLIRAYLSVGVYYAYRYIKWEKDHCEKNNENFKPVTVAIGAVVVLVSWPQRPLSAIHHFLEEMNKKDDNATS